MAALFALARSVGARFGGRAVARTGARGALARTGLVAGGAGLGGSLLAGAFGGGDDGPRRRRRKRVLTSSDRSDIAFVVATLGPTAGKSFAMIVAARA